MARPRKSNPHNLPPFVHEKHGGFYLVRDGKWTRLGNNVADAIAEFAKWMGSTKVGAPVVATAGKALSVADVIERALPSICKPVSAETARGYKSKARRLMAGLEKIAIGEFKARHVKDIRRDMAEEQATFNAMLSVLNLAMEWAVDEELLEVNPCVSVDRLDPDARERYITHDEFDRIYQKGTERLQVIMDFLYRSGQRVKDVRLIEYDHMVEAGVKFKQSKTKKSLVLATSPELRAVIARAKALDAGSVVRIDKPRFLFKGRGWEALPYNTLHGWWADACEAAGVEDAWIHDLRAKAATDVYLAHGGGEKGIAAAQALMGHASPAMTWRYIRSRLPNVVQGPGARVTGSA